MNIKKFISLVLVVVVISFSGLVYNINLAQASCNPAGSPPADPPDITSITSPNGGTFDNPTSIPVVINGQGGYQCTGDPNGGLGWDDVATSVSYSFVTNGTTVYTGYWNTSPCYVPICAPRSISVNTTVNSSSWPGGSYTMTATATGPGGLTDTMSTTFNVNRITVVPPPVSGSGTASLTIYNTPDVTFQINGGSSATVALGATATLSWTPVNSNTGTSCTAGNAWSGNVSGTPGTTYTQSTGVLPAGNYTYTLYCQGALGSVSTTKSVSLTVQPGIPTASITCNGTSTSCTIPYNTAATIAWSSSNATSCTVTPPNWTGTSGSQSTGNLTATTTYTVSCTGPGGSANASVIVNVGAQPDFSLSCSPSTQTIVAGSSASYNLATTPLNGFASAVSFSGTTNPSSGTPPTISFSNNNQVPSATTAAIITTTTSTTATTYTLDFTGTGGGQSHGCSVSITVIPLPTVSITCNGTSTSCTIPYNTAATIAWSSTNATSCFVSPPGWTGTSGSQSTGNLTSTTSYSISCTGAGGSANASVIVNVGAPSSPTASITCNGTSTSCTIPYNTAATIAWSSSNATSCTVTPPNWTGTSGSQSTGNLTATTTYTVSCTGPGGSANASVIVNVGAQPDFSLSCSPATQTIAGGDSAAYTITATAVNGFNSALTFSGSSFPSATRTMSFSFVPSSITPTASTTAVVTTTSEITATTYSLTFTATGGGQSHTCSTQLVITPPPTVSITCNGTSTSCTIPYNTAATIAWSSTNTTSCFVSPPGWTGTSGSQSTGNLTSTTSYSISCTGAGGSANASVIVNVGAPSAPTVSITCNGTSTSCTIPYNTAATIAWSSTNATSCTVTPPNWTGTSGSQSTGNLTSTTTYTASCTGAGGSANASVTVNVGSAPDFSLSCSPSTQTIVAGSSASYNLATTPLNGFASAVSFSGTTNPSSGTPPTISFSNNNQVPSATTAAVITTTTSTTATTYTLDFTGTGGGQSHGCQTQIVVTSPPPSADFVFTVSPSTQTVSQGTQAVYDVYVTCSGGFSGPVTGLQLSNLHSGATYQFMQTLSGPVVTQISACGSSNSVKLVIDTNAADTSIPTKTLTISGNGSGVGSRSGTADLTINALPGGNTFNLNASDKDVYAVNGVSNSGISSCSGNQTNTDIINSQFGLIKSGDIIKFKINLCNSGGVDANISQVIDNLTNLIKPANGWNAQYTDASGTSNISSGEIEETTNGSGIVTSIKFNFAKNNKVVPHRTISNGNIVYGVTSITFDAQVSKVGGGTAGLYRFQNKANVYEAGGTIYYLTTPLFLFNSGSSAPDLKEVAP